MGCPLSNKSASHHCSMTVPFSMKREWLRFFYFVKREGLSCSAREICFRKAKHTHSILNFTWRVGIDNSFLFQWTWKYSSFLILVVTRFDYLNYLKKYLYFTLNKEAAWWQPSGSNRCQGVKNLRHILSHYISISQHL